MWPRNNNKKVDPDLAHETKVEKMVEWVTEVHEVRATTALQRRLFRSSDEFWTLNDAVNDDVAVGADAGPGEGVVLPIYLCS